MEAAPTWVTPATAAPPADRLAALRAGAERLRDQELAVANAEQALADAKAAYRRLAHEELPDLMDTAGVDHVGLPARGNLPACDAVCGPYYKANIAADWAPERREAAFTYLEGVAPDIVRVVVSVQFGKAEMAEALDLRDYLQGQGYPVAVKMDVPWASLTAWVREQIERHQAALPLDLIGATVGRVVKIKPRKD